MLFLLITGGLVAMGIYCNAGTPSVRTILFLERGSGQTVSGLWNMASFNDLDGNKSLALFDEMKAGGTFKPIIDATWGTATTADVLYLNDYGDVLQFFTFDMAGKDIGILSEWFQLSTMTLAGVPLGVDDDLIAINGNNEFIAESSTGSLKAIVFNDHTTVNPTIMLAVNSSTTMEMQPSASTNEGCIADWELDFTLSFTDDISMTVAACLSSCTTSFSAVRFAIECYCVEFKTRIHNLLYMCNKVCAGDGKMCGGDSYGYFTVYSGSGSSTTNLDTITTSQEALLTVTHTQSISHTITIADELSIRGWTDLILYFNGISVDALNAIGEVVQYSLYFSADGTTFTQFLPNANPFDTDGSVVDTSIRFETAIKIMYASTVVSSTIHIYGPPGDSYVDVPYLQIDIHFDGITSSTGPPSTTTATTTTTSVGSASTSSVSTTTTSVGSASTSSVSTTTTSVGSASTSSVSPTSFSPTTMGSTVADIYDVFPNMTLLINGTLYCPCNDTNITYPPLTSIYDNMNLTFEERLNDLAVDPDVLSSNTRKYESAKDNRPSAATMGTLGIVSLISVLAFIVYLDSATLVLEAKKVKRNFRRCKKKCKSKTKVKTIEIKPADETIPISEISK
ncbi:hypothetical protein ACF0H5_015694 [Mactra antiquata]